VLLGNGCVCCITRTDLQVALRRLVFDRERGTVPRFARVVIETSGLADPAPILQTFSTDRALGGEFHIDVVLAVVDAVNGEAALDSAAEARKQVILADRLVISKTDLARRTVERLTRRLQQLNPRAAIDIAVAGALDPNRIIEPATGERSSFVAEAEHGDGITSFVIEQEQPIEWPAFSRAMETLIALRGPDLLRVKGILNVAGCRGPVVVQYVQHLAHPPVELQNPGRTRVTASREPRRLHHAQYWRSAMFSKCRDLFAAAVNRRPLLHHAGLGGGRRQDRHARRSRHAGEAASAANRLCRGTGAAMRLLHQRLDHDRGCLPARQEEADRR
jgi:G3E family GTPase